MALTTNHHIPMCPPVAAGADTHGDPMPMKAASEVGVIATTDWDAA